MKEQGKTIHNHFEAGANCQVFNGDVSGCVFAMPGAKVVQSPMKRSAKPGKGLQDVADRLKPMFFGEAEEAKAFLLDIQGMKATQITERVNRLVSEQKISPLSRHRDLWKVLHDCGLYDRTEANWNMQVE